MNFCWSFFKKISFGNNFIDLIKILLTNQESCVINDGSTTSYFKLEKVARQGDPVSACLFIIALEIIFAMIRSNPKFLIFSIKTTYILRKQMAQHFLKRSKIN